VKKLRIGIACYPTYGGSGVLATELGIALARQGHEIHLFSYARPTRLASYHVGIEFHNVSVSSYPLFHYPPYDLALSSVMRQVMCERSLDILHVHYAVPHAICAYLAREMSPNCSTKIVTTLHGTDITILGRDPSYRDVIPFGLQQSDAVVSVSEWLAEQTREVFDYSGPIDILPNFVDQQLFRRRSDDVVRNELGGKDQALLVHMSNFRSLKRAGDTIEILRRIGSHKPAKLLFVGDGPEQSAVRELAQRHGLCDKVRFLGEIGNVASVIAASDVAIFPSESESFGLAPLEAMACGVPVVTTNVGGLPEVVVHGESGFLHNIGDIEGMAADVNRLLEDPQLRNTMGQAGVERTTDKFSLTASLEQHEQLYSRILADSP
jgi:N-acetyl-alpha-D-glucosaminyl L-malate synthase BshA